MNDAHLYRSIKTNGFGFHSTISVTSTQKASVSESHLAEPAFNAPVKINGLLMAADS